MTDHEKLKAILKERGLTNPGGSIDYKKVAAITGHSYQSMKRLLRPNGELPRWCKLIVYLWDQENMKDNFIFSDEEIHKGIDNIAKSIRFKATEEESKKAVRVMEDKSNCDHDFNSTYSSDHERYVYECIKCGDVKGECKTCGQLQEVT